MNIIVGCPVRDRAWIMERWFEHVEVACAAAGIDDIEYVFVGDVVADNATAKAIGAAAELHGRPAEIEYVREGPITTSRRVWNSDRFRHMVDLRNQLLGVVRSLEPDLFWSLDSDVLAAEKSLASAVECLDRFGAVGTKLYLSAGKSAPNYAGLGRNGGLLRADADGVFPVEVIMASKVMTPEAYAVDYRFHKQGEDIGWSLAARKAGVKLGWDGRVCSKHVMAVIDQYQLDLRCGY